MKILIRFPLYFSLSVLIELFQFQSIGIRAPYPVITELWVVKHGLLALMLALLYKLNAIAHFRRRLLAYFGVAILTTVGIHLDYPHTKFCGIWCGDFAPLGIPFIFLGCVLETTLLLWLCDYLQKHKSPVSKLLYGALLLIPIYVLWRPAYIERLNKKYPVTWVFDQSYTSSTSTYMSIRHFRANEVLTEFEKLAAQISEKEWTEFCSQFDFLSFNNFYFGKAHADSCYYYAAMTYRNPLYCEKMVRSHRSDCESDVKTLQQVETEKKSKAESFHGIPMQRASVKPYIQFYSYQFAPKQNDKPFVSVFNPTDQAVTLEDVELVGGLNPRVIKKVKKLMLQPGEILKIELSDQKNILKELGFGEDFRMLGLQSQGKVIHSVHNPVLMPRYKSLCVKSWNLDPWSENPLFLEVYNFSKAIVDLERTELSVFGLIEPFTESIPVPGHQSKKVELERIRSELRRYLEKKRPTEVLKMTVIFSLMGSGETLAVTGSGDQPFNFCASTKQAE
ncbi:hypothetical protein EBR78_04320 [bacterium]|nr:hypothetical protein [bacterium]